ncbi:PREDICTED: F-box [Prunus dulcis]|uniref:PREDICTED: F-box n=1 Tax=Prunus dulcis TaxID=3755 RepID=A0A5E4FJG8_PRUDU|nr:PREDICTED: F-box [Prunus dulcis]
MKEDRSGWFVRCQIDFNTLAKALPRMMMNVPCRHFLISVATVLQGEEEYDLSIVLSVPRSVVQYNVKDKTSKKLRGLPRGFIFSEFSSQYLSFKAYKCIDCC